MTVLTLIKQIWSRIYITYRYTVYHYKFRMLISYLLIKILNKDLSNYVLRVLDTEHGAMFHLF